ncbi:hypothetical protein HBZC1_13000 [Helicobacter bizzozeronii CIII-1]|uniref:Uncharacterized protein n=1 Tax=Helicobacter bizzozeronii (strain CIII-1) TaxID=1002804 RepID=F8KTW1_HELBC|nr:hypothetical protein HBZC1_13000 [Helicobacter bizzozeronii CIII-1]
MYCPTQRYYRLFRAFNSTPTSTKTTRFIFKTLGSQTLQERG